MAYIKIFPIKVTDKKALDYITNPDKTDEKLLVSSFGCSSETADLEFAMTREQTKKNGMDKGDNLAFHLIQSLSLMKQMQKPLIACIGEKAPASIRIECI